ncbi:hypothetical protein Niako_3443 [Niastella koreensis GR20-10]|uniref:Uncharacterized protein n=1 Tax=Niastella koreensis (strain DSM 17620 / KACC 11465 / NBRC 106392 / GR20-10) TaxID=700598 RepID=G8TKR8_NIAKG|nr:hypothetical protein Niako_3443 [Niastella koreensis GR20-10]
MKGSFKLQAISYKPIHRFAANPTKNIELRTLNLELFPLYQRYQLCQPYQLESLVNSSTDQLVN